MASLAARGLPIRFTSRSAGASPVASSASPNEQTESCGAHPGGRLACSFHVRHVGSSFSQTNTALNSSKQLRQFEEAAHLLRSLAARESSSRNMVTSEGGVCENESGSNVIRGPVPFVARLSPGYRVFSQDFCQPRFTCYHHQ